MIPSASSAVHIYSQARRELAKLAPEVPAGQDDAGKASQAGAADKTQRYPNTGGRAYWKVGGGPDQSD